MRSARSRPAEISAAFEVRALGRVACERRHATLGAPPKIIARLRGLSCAEERPLSCRKVFSIRTTLAPYRRARTSISTKTIIQTCENPFVAQLSGPANATTVPMASDRVFICRMTTELSRGSYDDHHRIWTRSPSARPSGRISTEQTTKRPGRGNKLGGLRGDEDAQAHERGHRGRRTEQARPQVGLFPQAVLVRVIGSGFFPTRVQIIQVLPTRRRAPASAGCVN